MQARREAVQTVHTLTFKFDATPQGFCQDVLGQHVFKS